MGNALAINNEIERLFLVDVRVDKPWRSAVDIRQITQYYLDSSDIEIHESVINYRSVPLVSISKEESNILTKTEHWVSRIRIQNDTVIYHERKQKGIATTELNGFCQVCLMSTVLMSIPVLRNQILR